MVRIGLTEVGKTPYSVAIRRNDTPDSIIFTPRGHCRGQFPQDVQRQISSPSTCVMPKVASRMILRMLKVLTRFHGQTVSHNPH